MKSQLLPALAVVLLLGAAAAVYQTYPRLVSNPPPTSPPRSDFDRQVAAVGIIEPRSENIAIASHLPGVVARVFVVAGQEVAAGAPLLQLDTRALEASRAERQAGVATATARAATARAGATLARQLLRFAEGVADARSLSAEELSRRRSALEIAEAEVAGAEAGIAAAQAALHAVEVDLERSTITAPLAGRVLQVRIRPGEYAPAGPTAAPWLLLGDLSELHLRVDIDEHEAWRVRRDAAAIAQVRGNSQLRVRAGFVRFEPYVVPKQSLSGDSTERVDTRVLQAIYRLDQSDLPLFVGQQMDVFIDGAPLPAVAANP